MAYAGSAPDHSRDELDALHTSLEEYIDLLQASLDSSDEPAAKAEVEATRKRVQQQSAKIRTLLYPPD